MRSAASDFLFLLLAPLALLLILGFGVVRAVQFFVVPHLHIRQLLAALNAPPGSEAVARVAHLVRWCLVLLGASPLLTPLL